jgi:hypothetical protein
MLNPIDPLNEMEQSSAMRYAYPSFEIDLTRPPESATQSRAYLQKCPKAIMPQLVHSQGK